MSDFQRSIFFAYGFKRRSNCTLTSREEVYATPPPSIDFACRKVMRLYDNLS